MSTACWLRRSTVAATLLAASPLAAASFVAATSGLPPSNVGWDCSAFNPGGWTGVAFADVNRDGFDDLAAVGRLLSGLHVWLSDGTGNWTEASSGLDADCHGRSDVDFADLDRDGDPDLGTVAGINGPPESFANDTPGPWRAVSTGLGGGPGEGFTFGDFDGDGNADLAIVGHFSGGAQAFLGNGAGGWISASAGLTADLGGHRATAADFDGDGADELVSTQFFDDVREGVVVWKLDPATNSWTQVAFFRFNQPYGVATGDADRDGWPDLVVAAAQDVVGSQGGVHVFLNQGDGRTFVESSSGLPVRDAYYGDVAAGDLDDDGDLDIVAGDWGGALRVFLGDGAGAWTEETASGFPGFGDKVEGLGLGDLDGDCRLDVGVAGYRSGVEAWRNVTPVGCTILPEAGPPRTVCAGAAVTLDASSTRACGCGASGVVYRFFEGGVQLRDWAIDPVHVVFPAGSTSYRVDAACAADPGCFRSDFAAVGVVSGVILPALGNVLKLARELPATVRFAWTDLASPVDGYEVLTLETRLGPPTQAAFDGPLAVVAATALPGAGGASVIGAITTPPGLVFSRVRATSAACGGSRGPA